MARTLREGGGVMNAYVKDDNLYLGTHTGAAAWDLRNGQKIKTFEGGHKDYIWSIVVDDSSVYTASSQNSIVQWSRESGREIRRLDAPVPTSEDPAQCHVWAIDILGDSLYSGSSDGIARQWDKEKGEVTNTFEGHTGWVTSLTLTRREASDELYTGSADGTCRSWDCNTGGCTRVYDLQGMCVMSLRSPTSHPERAHLRTVKYDTDMLAGILTAHFTRVVHAVTWWG